MFDVRPASAGLGALARTTSAFAHNEIVKEQRTITDRIDINNASATDFMQLPGIYPGIAIKLANNGPYLSVREACRSKVFNKEEVAMIKGYKKHLTVMKAAAPQPLVARRQTSMSRTLLKLLTRWIESNPNAFDVASEDGFLTAREIAERITEWHPSSAIMEGLSNPEKLEQRLMWAVQVLRNSRNPRLDVKTIGHIPTAWRSETSVDCSHGWEHLRLFRFLPKGKPDLRGKTTLQRLSVKKKATYAARMALELNLPTRQETYDRQVNWEHCATTAAFEDICVDVRPRDTKALRALFSDGMSQSVVELSVFAAGTPMGEPPTQNFPEVLWGSAASTLMQRTLATGQPPNIFEGLSLEVLSRLCQQEFTFLKVNKYLVDNLLS